MMQNYLLLRFFETILSICKLKFVSSHKNIKLMMKKILLIIIPVIVAICIYKINSNNIPDDNYSSDKKHLSRNIHHFDNLDDVKININIPSQIKKYTGFTLSFNRENHTPNWVSWELLDSEVDGNTPRSDYFWHDDEIEGCPSHADYKRSGFDRGHMVPAADQKWSKQAMEDCFVMANMCPQEGGLNSGAWNTLESHCRRWAKRDSAIIIVAGPIYETTDNQRLGKSRVRVPSAFFKAVIAPYIPSPRGIAFIYPNMQSPGNMQHYCMTIDEVEKITNFDLFYNLPDDLEHTIESTCSFTDWNKK